ncbi:MAG: hypothetical protein AAFQ41_12155 [Cyanobacteria bacterium J06623_7]
MNAVNYQSPNIFLLLHHQISVNDANKMIEKWLQQHPQESRASLSKLLESEQVIVKHGRIQGLPRLSLTEATELVQELKKGSLVVKDRQHNLSTYPQCFIGSELVDWLMTHRELLEAEAIALGQNLLEHDLISHVLRDHDFKNEFLFYQFQDASTPELPTLSLGEATALAQELQKNGKLTIKNRRHRLNSYKQCFIGSELVDCLVTNHNASVAEAIAMGQSLSSHNLIAHVHHEHDFKNEFLFYQFQNS